MTNTAYLKIGRLFYAVSILCIGLVHLVAGHFPLGLFPVPVTLPGKMALTYISGIALISAGMLILTGKYRFYGLVLAGVIWLLVVLLIHLPVIVHRVRNPAGWTGAFEAAIFLAGALMLASISKNSNTLLLIGKYLFASALLVFGIQHAMYLQFIVTLIPEWIPVRVFWAYVVMVAFFASALSILINKQASLAAMMLGLMFLLWFLILHVPRVISHPHDEPEWTSMFVVLGASSVSLILAYSMSDIGISIPNLFQESESGT